MRIHDVVVVGSGIGGLTAAALCAAEGLDVVVLEGHDRPGGCAGDFRRRRVLFPAGATVVMGFEVGGLHRWVYERLGLPIVAQRLDLAMRVHLPDREVAVLTERAAWDAERRRAFPEIGQGGDRFWGQVRRLGAIAHDLAACRPALPITSTGDLLDAARLVRPPLLRAVTAVPALWQTVSDLLRSAGMSHNLPHRRFVDNQLLISMQCLADECVALSGALALDVYRYGTYRLPNGTATIANDLVTALERRGGVIHYRARVQRLVREQCHWSAVTADERRLAARAVVTNVPPANLLDLLDGPQPASLATAARRRTQPWGAVVLFAALEPTGLGGPLPRYHQILESYDTSLEDGGSCFVSLFGPEPDRPGSPARLTVSTHTRVDPWWDLTDRAAYLDEKQRIGERLLRAAERAIPDFRSRLLFWEVATPRSYRRWTGRHEGRVGGFAQTQAHANLRALSYRTGRPGLFLCGDSVFPGQGTIGVTLSGINAARSAVRHVRAAAARPLAHSSS